MRRTILAVLFAVYLVVLIDLTLIGFRQPGAGWNLMPLMTIRHYWTVGGMAWIINVIGNLAAFGPLGVFLGTSGVRWSTALRALQIGAALSLAIESLQYASGQHVADIDDVLLNALGTLLGYLCIVGGRRLALSLTLRRPIFEGP